MADILVSWIANDARGDWSLVSGDLDTGDDLATAILLSLFTDRSATASDSPPDGSGDRRGWWGDREIGSRLWLLDRAKQTEETRRRAADYVAEALQWLIDDGVVARFTIRVEWARRSTLGVWVIAHRSDGQSTSFNFDWAWQGVA
ncbi:hypothetical protein D3877_11410 [Azospirillum cavernae]|uniref:Uncharacterized protein n=1 Tax=Azospirillum cavernae TaxID=2320860 RepID=A0A418W4Z1_9PROT|nr:phage GP46 family protein [Azospirillum cavernae]RJF85048.1 hypothetical protein D3877_11410 [Azospirillum cavernae]